MRYHLSTLILVTILLSACAGLYIRNRPWIPGEFVSLYEARKIAPPGFLIEEPPYIGIDRSGKYFQTADGMGAVITHKTQLDIIPDGRIVTTIPGNFVNSHAIFLNDDTILAYTAFSTAEHSFRTFHRRFPEYRLGYLYRFETWAAILSGLVLAYYGIRKLLKRLYCCEPVKS